MPNNIINDIGYTGIGDKNSKRKIFLLIDKIKFAEIESKFVNEEESNDLQGEGIKITIP